MKPLIKMTRLVGIRPTKTLWIFCEGKTEENYFEKLRIIERINRLQIKSCVTPKRDAGDILKYAISHCKAHFQKGDLVACVFDVDSNSDADLIRAKRMADDYNYAFYLSNPCFEYWILCHYGLFQTKFDSKELTSKVISFIPRYKKPFQSLYLETRGKIGAAKKNAEKMKKIHFGEGRELFSREANPLTLIFELVQLIDKFKD